MGKENSEGQRAPYPKPTLEERWSDLYDAASIIGRQNGSGDNTPPQAMLFTPTGSLKSSIGILPPHIEEFMQIPLPPEKLIPQNPDAVIRLPLDQEESAPTDNKVPPQKKANQKPMKDNQVRHSQNLGGLNGWYKGKLYENGQPKGSKKSQDSKKKKNGNGKR